MQKNNTSADSLHEIKNLTSSYFDIFEVYLSDLLRETNVAPRLGVKPQNSLYERDLPHVEGQPQTEPNIYAMMGRCRVQAHTPWECRKDRCFQRKWEDDV